MGFLFWGFVLGGFFWVFGFGFGFGFGLGWVWVGFVLDACSTVCLSTAVMTMQQSLGLIGGGSLGVKTPGDPTTPPVSDTGKTLLTQNRNNGQLAARYAGSWK